MSQQVQTHHVQQYADNVTLTAQQEDNRLMSRVFVKDTRGRRQSFDQIGKEDMILRSGRHQRTGKSQNL